ncbi:alpha/beta fold hydrolase [Microbacterium sp. LWO12-1.2]|uniref:alpha/beta fold hydrolase n=1 Tax=Microbacterium sp. LWO12-1.2 TaxID=3135261 RepID=UPI003424D027
MSHRRRRRPWGFPWGEPVDASGFQAQVTLFEDRTVVTYDPRGLGRSIRKDGAVTNEPEIQAEDVHAIIEALKAAPTRSWSRSARSL